MIKKILLIGGAGYIGSVLCDYFLSKGYQVSVLDIFLYKNNHSILPFIDHEAFSVKTGDLCDSLTLDEAIEGVTDVVLLAGLVGDLITKKYPVASRKINELGIRSCINHLNGKGINRLVFISTCSNYGIVENNELANEEHELKPLSAYASAKVSIEKYILSRKGYFDFAPTILRFATAFGLSHRMRFDLTVNEFSKEIALGRELIVYDEQTWRPYCHVKDFARLIEQVLLTSSEKIAYEVFNAGGDVNNFTKQGIVEKIREQAKNPNVIYQANSSDPRNYKVSFEKVKTVLKFEPEYKISDGISEVFEAIESGFFDGIDTPTKTYGNYKINYE
ncbi:NAD-dependent epimerase/dehydratase [Candidatus Poribacteria bacterium]|nr:NAD-dependent epimerase/dehydratase [Candidatus Poribacteria bacterium]